MDIYCRHCGEPWEVAELHEVYPGVRGGFPAALSGFYRLGCGVFDEPRKPCKHTPITDPETLSGIAMLQDMLGPDVDGLASELEDGRAMGVLNL